MNEQTPIDVPPDGRGSIARDGLVFACLLDGQGGGRPLDWAGLQSWTPADGLLWIHLDRRGQGARDWLLDRSGVDPAACEALLLEETRPHCAAFDAGLLLLMRGINLNPGADPEDMVSLRLWIDDNRVITLRHRKVVSVQEIRQSLDNATGPRRLGELVTQISGALIARIGGVIGTLDDRVDELESEVLTSRSPGLRRRLHAVRHQAIDLRRYIAPQRDALAQLALQETAWLEPLDRARLRETGDRLTRYVEDLDAARERASVVQDELSTRLSEETNRTMYILSLLATIFLPLGFVTGLLGMNVGGMPLTDDPWAFVEVCAALGALGVLQLLLFTCLKWI